MPNGPLAQLLEAIQTRRRERGLPTPFAAAPQPAPQPQRQPSGGGQRLGPSPAPAQPQRGNEQVAQLQQHLVNAGFNPGPIDGLMGPRTQAALSAFNRSHMASAPPMQRPGTPTEAPEPFVPMARPRSGAVPLPPGNPERMIEGAPLLAMGDAAPVTPVSRGTLGPASPSDWRPANERPDVYGPGMAVPRGRSIPFSAQPVPQPGFDALLNRLFPETMGMDVAQRNYDALPVEGRRNIERMNMAQLQDFINSADPSPAELRRASMRLEQLRVEALMMGQGVGQTLQGAPMLGPGV